MENMESTTYKELLNKMIHGTKNMLILGCAGSGKTFLVKSMMQELERQSKEGSILLCAPSGIASLNINGCTIQSLFNIKPYTYDIYPTCIGKIRKIKQIRNARILLIDEISMLRCEILDIADSKLKILTEEFDKPFGGLRLICIGDLFQMEPVVQEKEYEFMYNIYPDLGIKDYCFFNAHVMKNYDYFNSSFDIYRLDHIFRQSDRNFIDILSEVRMGNISDNSLISLNEKVIDTLDFDENYQYLCITNDRAEMINKRFIERLDGTLYYSKPEYLYGDSFLYSYIKNCQCPINKVLVMKIGMKVMFVINDREKGPFSRYVNGSIGYIEDINTDLVTNEVLSVLVNINGCNHLIEKSNYSVFDKINNEMQEVGQVRNFPFTPSYAITIDKSQGLTLDKIAIILARNNIRDNQIYVALSRARSLDNIIFDRKIKPDDIHISPTMKRFYSSISNRIVPVIYNKFTMPISIKIKNSLNTHITFNIKSA
ncbi:hypothetical protein AGMMS49546_16790 [Spirochaetia bacterium]|nr:hypothetical protein AGMMS49546_16790 [Spirochaetia bacterium]